MTMQLSLVERLGGKPSGDPEMPKLELPKDVEIQLNNKATAHRVAVFAAKQWPVRAAGLFEDSIKAVLSRQDQCVVALSGGRTPAPVFAELAKRNLAWSRVTMIQVDERVAPIDSGDRNIVGLHEAFSDVPVNWIPMPVDDDDLVVAGSHYAEMLAEIAGDPPALDIVHLGLGGDGHTASLVPGDPVLSVVHRDIAITGLYQGTRRMTMTRAVLERADLTIWLIAGSAKSEAVKKLLRSDQSIPAGQLELIDSVVVLDDAAIAGAIE